MKCNYKCQYCTNLDKTLKPVTDRAQIKSFISMLGETYPGVEIFVFGGEPFVHPDIEYIIECFNEMNIPFVIQTNFSTYSVKRMLSIPHPFNINISVHPTETTIAEISMGLKGITIPINNIDVMYTGKEAIDFYRAVTKLTDCKNVFLTPVTDFGDGYSDILLAEYNQLKQSPVYSRIIKFENIIRFGKPRSEVWIDPTFITRGNPCLYAGRYFLYGPNLELYNCCYRIQTDGTCPKDKCFLM